MIIGVDIGGTKVNALLIDPRDGSIHGVERASSAGDGTTLTATIVTAVDRLRARAETPIRHVGLGVAGLAHRSGVIRYSPNLPDLIEYPLGPAVAEACGATVLVINDATAGAWAEHRLGAGRGVDDFAFVSLGTGIGAGFVVDGRLVLGAHGFAGEVGHMVVDRHGPTHITGQQGPWEYDASGTALGRMGREAARAGHFDLGAASAGNAESVSGPDVAAAVHDGDAQALAILGEFADNVAVGLANLVAIFDPHLVIIGGGLADIGEPLRGGIDRSLGARLLGAEHRPAVDVVIAELGPDAGALGAGILAWEGDRDT